MTKKSNVSDVLIEFVCPGFGEDEKAPVLKDLFDNLRNYPLLALLAATAAFVETSSLVWAPAAVLVIKIFVIALGAATSIQSAFLLTWIAGHFLASMNFFPKRVLLALVVPLVCVIFLGATLGGIAVFRTVLVMQAKMVPIGGTVPPASPVPKK